MSIDAYATPKKFWKYFIEKYKQEINNLRPYQCLGPFQLNDLAKKFNMKVRKAPELISITVLSKLPRVLYNENLYVIRLGQRHHRSASLIVCKASHSFSNEVIYFKDLLAAKAELMIPYSYSLWQRLKKLSGEALATSAALKAIHYVHDMFYIIPQYRGGSSKFMFRINEKEQTYEYWGQVEVDAVALGSLSLAYIVEAKQLQSTKEVASNGIFKFQIAFSMQTIANKLDIETRGVLALRIPSEQDIVRVAFLKPGTWKDNILAINDLTIDFIADVKPVKV